MDDEIDIGTLERMQQNFISKSFLVAIVQGRLAYFIMSFYAVSPGIQRVLGYDLGPFLFANMIYGVTAMIYSRPSLNVIFKIHRLAFSFFGSMMFNYSSLVYYAWLYTKLPHRPYTRAVIGFFSGRFMMLHLLLYLYHVDKFTSYPEYGFRRYSAFESMYPNPSPAPTLS